MLTQETKTRTIARFEEHRRAWDGNPALRALYGEWYGRVAELLPPENLGMRVELGSGPGLARVFIPDLMLTDLVKAPWHDRELSAEALPFEDGSLGAMVLFDVLHHLPAPRRFFAEAARVLRPGGRVVMCEPYMSALSYPVYRMFHAEPVDMRGDPWGDAADPAAAARRDPFDANQAIPTLLFGRHRRAFQEAFPELAIRRIEQLAGLSYPISGGFSRRPLLPAWFCEFVRRFEARLPKLAFRLIGFRMLVVLERVSL